VKSARSGTITWWGLVSAGNGSHAAPSRSVAGPVATQLMVHLRWPAASQVGITPWLSLGSPWALQLLTANRAVSLTDFNSPPPPPILFNPSGRTRRCGSLSL
jgi:hypothetical protein